MIVNFQFLTNKKLINCQENLKEKKTSKTPPHCPTPPQAAY